MINYDSMDNNESFKPKVRMYEYVEIISSTQSSSFMQN